MGRTVKANDTSPSSSNAKLIMAALVVSCIAISVFVLWWISPRVELDERSYDITLALCRVCNQQSIDGLERIEGLLLDPATASKDADPSRVLLLEVIAKAKRNQWSDAERECRNLLENQVTR